MTNIEIVRESVTRLSTAEQRELLARLWSHQAQRAAGEVWQTVRLSPQARLVAYAPEQEIHLPALRRALENGVLARRENEADGTFEIYGPDRTYYVTLTLAREFVGLLSSWPPEAPPREIHLAGDE